MDALLTILSKASCFPEDLRKQASKAREVRNQWLCSNLDRWTVENASMAIVTLNQLARMTPGARRSMKNLELKFPGISFHSNLQRYRSRIKGGQHEKVEFKINQLQSKCGREIYVERRYKETKTGQHATSILDLVLPNRVVLLKRQCWSRQKLSGNEAD